MAIQRDLEIATQTLSENTSSCNCDANSTKMCGYECGSCEYFKPDYYSMNYEGSYCNYYSKPWSASADACEHYR